MSINEIISSYLAAKDAETAAKKQADAMKKLLIDHAGSADHFTTDVYTVVIKTTISSRLDTAALYRDFPDVKAAYGKETVSRSVTAVENAAAAQASA